MKRPISFDDMAWWPPWLRSVMLLLCRYLTQGAGASPYDKQLATLGHSVMLKMMLHDNFIHSDLHPGNIMVQLDTPSNPVLQAASKLCSTFGV